MIDSTFITLNIGLCYTVIGSLSLLIGSLLNVFIYRLPRMLEAEFRADCCCLLNMPNESATPMNLFLPRSFCPACKHTVRAQDNIPIISYLLLKGRCHYCQHTIPSRYPLVEALSCCLALFASWQLGINLTLLFALVFIWLLIVLFFIDLDYQLLPDNLTLSLLWLGLLANTQGLFVPLTTAVMSAMGAYLSLWLFIKIFYLITGKIGMGHGDFKLFAAFGAWFGWSLLPLILVFASLTGAVIGIIYLKIKRQAKDTPIAFGPFLCAGGLLALFWGKPFVQWYLTWV